MKKYFFELSRPVASRFGGLLTEATAVAGTPEEAWEKVREDVLPKNQKLRKLAEKRHPLNAMKMKVLLDFDLVAIGKSTIDFVDTDGVAVYDYTIVAVDDDKIIANGEFGRREVEMNRVFNLH